jgi:hypothetical protein
MNTKRGASADANTRLDRIIHRLSNEILRTLSNREILWLCNLITPVVLKEPTLLDLTGPINICRDIHGQFFDLLRVLRDANFSPDRQFLFLGDYVDGGDSSIEVVCLLFALKLRHPESIFLLRVNHESPEMTENFGFAEECALKYHSATLPTFHAVFRSLPIAAPINGRTERGTQRKLDLRLDHVFSVSSAKFSRRVPSHCRKKNISFSSFGFGTTFRDRQRIDVHRSDEQIRE